MADEEDWLAVVDDQISKQKSKEQSDADAASLTGQASIGLTNSKKRETVVFVCY